MSQQNSRKAKKILIQSNTIINIMSGQFTEDYRIPDSLVGLVIGRGGEQIKRMQQDGDGTM